eukprot:m.888548 g.888548  ORF g.888548 m.888548 type:complete len:1040 (-) comp59933_c0_seq2:1457-4576(-)
MSAVAICVLALLAAALLPTATACTASQYELSPSVCADLTVCNPFKEFESVPPTPTSDRSCTAFLASQLVDINVPFVTATALAADSASLLAGLVSMGLADVTFVRFYNVLFGGGANFTFVCIPPGFSIPRPATEVLSNIQVTFQSTTCNLQGIFANCLDAALGYDLVSFGNSPIQATTPTLAPGPTTSVSFGAGSVAALAALSKTWINAVQPSAFPMDVFNQEFQLVINGSIDLDLLRRDALSYALPMLTMTSFAFLMALLVPSVMLVICCCRMRKSCCCHVGCGGRRLQDKPRPNQRICLELAAFVLAVLIILSGTGLAVGGSQLVSGKKDLESVLYDTITQVYDFKDSTLAQAQSIPNTQVPVLDGNLRQQIENLATTETATIPGDLQPTLTATNNELASVSQSIAVVSTDVSTLESSRQATAAALPSFSSLLSTFASTSSSNQTTCSAVAVSPANQATWDAICAEYITTPITVGPNFATLPSLTAYVSQLAALDGSNIGQYAATTTSNVNAIPTAVSDSIDLVRLQLDADMGLFQGNMTQQIQSVALQVNNDFAEYFDETQYKENIYNIFHSNAGYTFDTYHQQITLGFSVVFFIVGAFVILGVLAGMGGASAYKDPRERGFRSNCGGYLLLWAVGIVSVMALGTNFFAGAFFLYASFASKTCEVFQSNQFFAEVLDNTANFDGRQLLSPLTFNNVTVLEVTTACRANAGLFTAAQLDSRFNLTDLLSTAEYIDPTALLGSLTNVNTVPAVALTLAQQYEDMRMDLLDLAPFSVQNTITLTSMSLASVQASTNQLIADLNAFQSLENPPELAQVIADANALLDVVNMAISAANSIESLRLAANNSIVDLQALVPNINSTVDALLSNASALSSLATSAISSTLGLPAATTEFQATLDAFELHLADEIRNNMGQCKFVVDLYDQAVGATCETGMSGLHALWFSLALLAFFSLFLIYVGLKLSRFFDSLSDYFTDYQPHDISLTTLGGSTFKPYASPQRTQSNAYLYSHSRPQSNASLFENYRPTSRDKLFKNKTEPFTR